MILLPGTHARLGSKRGSTLLLSLLATVVVVSLSAVFLQLTSSIAKRQSQAADQKRSFYLAEAGLAEAFAGLRSGKSGQVGTQAEPALYGSGLFWVDATSMGDDLVSLSSTGMSGSALSELDIVVKRGELSVAALGVFSAGDLVIGSGSSLTSFDSSAGGGGGGAAFGGSGQQVQQTTTLQTEGRTTLYKEIGTRGVARVSSNGNIQIDQESPETTRVLGDLRPGVNGTLSKSGSPSITGSTAPLVTAVRLPAVKVPSYAQRAGYTHAQVQPMVLPAVNGSYQFLGVTAGSELTLSGPSEIVLEQLVVFPGAQLTFDTSNGPINIIITDKLDFRADSLLDVTSGSSLDLSLQVSSNASAELRGTCNFYGTLYAPTAEIVIDEDFKLYGSVVANQLTLNGACQLSFDASLGRSAEMDALPVMVSWRIMELDSAATPNGDLFGSLGLIKTLMEAPSDAHQDQILELSYVDSTGTDAIYSGWESDFDWSEVSQVLNMTRDGETVGGIEGLSSIGATGDGTGLVALADKTLDATMTPKRDASLSSFK